MITSTSFPPLHHGNLQRYRPPGARQVGRRLSGPWRPGQRGWGSSRWARQVHVSFPRRLSTGLDVQQLGGLEPPEVVDHVGKSKKEMWMAKQDPRGSSSGLGGFLGSFLFQRAVKRHCQSLRHEMRLGGPGFHAKEETSRLVIPSLLWGAQTWTKAGLHVVPSCHHLSSHPTRHAAAKAPDAGRRRRWCVLGKSRVWPKKATHGAKYRNLPSITVLKIIHCCVVKGVTRGKLSSSTFAPWNQDINWNLSILFESLSSLASHASIFASFADKSSEEPRHTTVHSRNCGRRLWHSRHPSENHHSREITLLSPHADG